METMLVQAFIAFVSVHFLVLSARRRFAHIDQCHWRSHLWMTLHRTHLGCQGHRQTRLRMRSCVPVTFLQIVHRPDRTGNLWWGWLCLGEGAVYCQGYDASSWNKNVPNDRPGARNICKNMDHLLAVQPRLNLAYPTTWCGAYWSSRTSRNYTVVQNVLRNRHQFPILEVGNAQKLDIRVGKVLQRWYGLGLLIHHHFQAMRCTDANFLAYCFLYAPTTQKHSTTSAMQATCCHWVE